MLVTVFIKLASYTIKQRHQIVGIFYICCWRRFATSCPEWNHFNLEDNRMILRYIFPNETSQILQEKCNYWNIARNIHGNYPPRSADLTPFDYSELIDEICVMGEVVPPLRQTVIEKKWLFVRYFFFCINFKSNIKANCEFN